jgi:hypothetical protein
LEQVFELSYMNLTFLSHSGHYQCYCPLVYFVSVLRIHSFNLVYYTAYAFTPSLTGLLWMSQLLLLEYTLPLVPYKTLPLVSQPELSDLAGPLHSARRRFLCHGSLYVVGYLIELLVIRQGITQTEGQCANITWTRNS